MSTGSWFSRTPTDADDEAVAATGLNHKLWLQESKTAPLFLMVHGRAGNRNVMWTFCHATPTSATLLMPEAFLDDPHDGGRSWWLTNGMTDEALTTARQRLETFLQASLDRYQLQPTKIIGVGFSQGGALLSVLAQDSPNLFAGIALLASFVVERPPQTATPTTKIFVSHGTKDTVVPLEKVKTGATFLKKHGYEVAFHEDEVEHKVGKTGMRELKLWTASLVSS